MEERLQRLERRCRLLTLALVAAFLAPWLAAANKPDAKETNIFADHVFAKSFTVLKDDKIISILNENGLRFRSGDKTTCELYEDGLLLYSAGKVTSSLDANHLMISSGEKKACLIKAETLVMRSGEGKDKVITVMDADGLAIVSAENKTDLGADGLIFRSTKGDNAVKSGLDLKRLYVHSVETKTAVNADGVIVESAKDENQVGMLNSRSVQAPIALIVDAKGKTQVSMGPNGIMTSALTVQKDVRNDTKQSSIQIAVWEKMGPALSLFDKNGTPRLRLGTTLFEGDQRPRPSLVIWDDKQTMQVALDDQDDNDAKKTK